MKKISIAFIASLCFSTVAFAQFPKLPKIDIPKVPKTTATPQSGGGSGSENSAMNQTNNPDLVAPKLPPTAVIKPSLIVRADQDKGYWKLPDAPNYWSWMPEVQFMMTGPVEDASFLTYEFFTPDGKPWFSEDTAPFSIPDGGSRGFESKGVPSWKYKHSSIATGKFTFKVTLKNNLQGTSKELYKGMYVVGKKFAGTPHPDFKNQNAFYVDQDWRLPIGMVSYDWKQDTKAPPLGVNMWFHGDMNAGDLSAYLFYNGKQISSTKTSNQGADTSVGYVIHEGDDNNELQWQNWRFTFYNIRLSNGGGSYPDAFSLSKNPGDYEIKILFDGELVRAAKFSVGPGGSVVDNGVAAGNGFGALGTVIPVTITPGKEKLTNLSNWKADAFYGNPLTGFTAQ